MPTYEYECQKCKKKFDVVQSMRDATLKVCPKEVCRMRAWGKGKVRRLLSSGAGLIFKGSGFYITDYRSEGYKQAAKKESDAASTGTGQAAPQKKEGGEASTTKSATTKESLPKKASKTGDS